MIHAPAVFRTRAVDADCVVDNKESAKDKYDLPSLSTHFPSKPYEAKTPAYSFSRSGQGKRFPVCVMAPNCALDDMREACERSKHAVAPNESSSKLTSGRSAIISSSKKEDLFNLKHHMQVPAPTAYNPDDKLLRSSIMGGALPRATRVGHYDPPDEDSKTASLQIPTFTHVKPRPLAAVMDRADRSPLWPNAKTPNLGFIYDPDDTLLRLRTRGGTIGRESRKLAPSLQKRQQNS